MPAKDVIRAGVPNRNSILLTELSHLYLRAFVECIQSLVGVDEVNGFLARTRERAHTVAIDGVGGIGPRALAGDGSSGVLIDHPGECAAAPASAGRDHL